MLCWGSQKRLILKNFGKPIPRPPKENWNLQFGELGIDIIIPELSEQSKNTIALCVCHLSDEPLQSWLAPERTRWRSKNCLSIFNHSNNHYDWWNRTDLKTAACYLHPAVAPLWIPLHDKHLSLSEPSAVQYLESKKVGFRNSNSKLVGLILDVKCGL